MEDFSTKPLTSKSSHDVSFLFAPLFSIAAQNLDVESESGSMFGLFCVSWHDLEKIYKVSW